MARQYLNLVLVLVFGALAAWLTWQDNMTPAFGAYFVMVLVGVSAFRTHRAIMKKEAAATQQDNSRHQRRKANQ